MSKPGLFKLTSQHFVVKTEGLPTTPTIVAGSGMKGHFHADAAIVDTLYHLGLDSKMDVIKTFADVKLVITCGSNGRANNIARMLSKVPSSRASITLQPTSIRSPKYTTRRPVVRHLAPGVCDEELVAMAGTSAGLCGASSASTAHTPAAGS